MSQLFQELKRRNVFRVAIAYLAVSWLILQLADVVLDNIAAPAWLMQALMFFIIVGFPVALLFAWAFELTPEGIKRERDVDRSTSITHHTGRRLDFVVIGVLGIAIVFLLVDKLALDGAAPKAEVTDKSVAVLPFVAMSSGPDDEYFADGLTEEILNSLTRVPELLVTARTSAFHFKGEDIPPIPEIAAILGVAHIVEGSVRRDGQRLRVTAQLIRAVDGFHLWAENYDHNTEDTFGVQTDIAEKIATALGVVLDDEQLEKMHAFGLRNPEAFVAYQKGVELANLAHGIDGQVEMLLEANIWFEKALSLAPQLSAAHLWHSDYFAHFLIDNIGSKDVTDEERTVAYEQLKQDMDNAIRTALDEPASLAAAFDRALLTANWQSLPAMFDDIVAQSSCYMPGWYDMTSLAYGQARENLIIGQRIIECDPLDYGGWTGAIDAYLWLGDHESAIATAIEGKRALSHRQVDWGLFESYVAAGRFDEAAARIDRDIRGEAPVLRAQVMLAAARGDAVATKSLLEKHFAADDSREDLWIEHFAMAGERDIANEMAAEADSDPFGYLLLMTIPSNCMCGAPFDLEATPNFAKLLDDANLPWPPASPIDWPLKDW